MYDESRDSFGPEGLRGVRHVVVFDRLLVPRQSIRSTPESFASSPVASNDRVKVSEQSSKKTV
jgi:hypothetical protein